MLNSRIEEHSFSTFSAQSQKGLAVIQEISMKLLKTGFFGINFQSFNTDIKAPLVATFAVAAAVADHSDSSSSQDD
jgi:hypothetical protein